MFSNGPVPRAMRAQDHIGVGMGGGDSLAFGGPPWQVVGSLPHLVPEGAGRHFSGDTGAQGSGGRQERGL